MSLFNCINYFWEAVANSCPKSWWCYCQTSFFVMRHLIKWTLETENPACYDSLSYQLSSGHHLKKRHNFFIRYQNAQFAITVNWHLMNTFGIVDSSWYMLISHTSIFIIITYTWQRSKIMVRPSSKCWLQLQIQIYNFKPSWKSQHHYLHALSSQFWENGKIDHEYMMLIIGQEHKTWPAGFSWKLQL